MVEVPYYKLKAIEGLTSPLSCARMTSVFKRHVDFFSLKLRDYGVGIVSHCQPAVPRLAGRGLRQMLVSPSAHGARDIAHKKPTDKVLTASEELGLRLFLKERVSVAREAAGR